MGALYLVTIDQQNPQKHQNLEIILLRTAHILNGSPKFKGWTQFDTSQIAGLQGKNQINNITNIS